MDLRLAGTVGAALFASCVLLAGAGSIVSVGSDPAVAAAVHAHDPATPAAASPEAGPAARPGAVAALPSATVQPMPVAPVAVMVSLSHALRVGEFHELVVALGPDSGVADVAFTLRLDGQVLQVRSATAGGWGAGVGVHAAFDAVIGDAEDRVDVRTVLPSVRAGRRGGVVAQLQLQALAPGVSTVQVSDIVLRDAAGRALPASPASALVHVTVNPSHLRRPLPQPHVPATPSGIDAAAQGD